tara:strand:+ start:27 stop:1904 length:1878 start_codon:yes stop_codon:yes gene_type:complete
MATNENIGEALSKQTEELKTSLSLAGVTTELKKMNAVWSDGSDVVAEIEKSSAMNLDALSKNTKENIKSNEKRLKEEKSNSPLALLSKNIESQNGISEMGLGINSLGEKLGAMNNLFWKSTENSKALVEEFKVVKSILEDPKSSPEEIKLAKENIAELEKLASSEEDNRENKAKLDLSNSLLGKISSYAKTLGLDFRSMAKGLGSNKGLLGALAASLTLLFDPETFINIIRGAMNFVFDMFESINKIVEGDIGGALELIWENIGTFTLLLLGIGLKFIFFGVKIIEGFRALKNAVTAVHTFMQMKWLPQRIADFTSFKNGLMKFGGKGFQLLKKAMTAARVFMMGTFIPAMMGMFTSLSVAMAPILAAIAPMLVPALLIVGIALAIGLVIKSLYNAFNDSLKVFEETGSYMEAFKAFISGFGATLFGFPMDLLKDAISWVASALGFEDVAKDLDSFSFQDIIKDGINGVIDWITDLMDFDFIGSLKSTLPDWAKSVMGISEDKPATETVKKAIDRDSVGWGDEPRGREIDPVVSRKDWKDPSGKKWGNPAKIEKMEADSGVYTKTNENINAKSVADKQPGNVVIAPGGSSSNNNSTNNVSTSNVTVSNGITPDDMIKKDFYNYGY